MIRLRTFCCQLRKVPSLRRQLALTVVVWGVCGARVFAMAEEGVPLSASSLFSWQNILTAGVLVYHFGMLREQFKSVIARLDKLEKDRDDEMKARLAKLEGGIR